MLINSKLWKRLLVNAVDLLILMFGFAALFTMIGNPQMMFISLGLSLISLPAWNAAWIHYTKTTPARTLFGLQVTDIQGKKLPFYRCLKAFYIPDKGILTSVKKFTWLSKGISLFVLGTSLLTFSMNSTLAPVKTGLVKNFVISGWIKFKAKEGGFSVQLPCKPKFLEKELPLPPSGAKTIPYNEYISKIEGDLSYSVSYIDVPSKWTSFGVQTILKESLRIIGKAQPGFELLDKEFKNFAGHNVLDFKAILEGRQIEGRLLFIGSKLFKLEVNLPVDSNHDIQEVEQFLNSFKLS